MKELDVEMPDQVSMISRLRQATKRIHLRLHKHPLMVELLERPSISSYQTVLLSFLRFYNSFEPRLVRDARTLGCSTHYPRLERIEWLTADLEALNSDLRRSGPIGDDHAESGSPTIGEFVGRLYVVRGSALGGRGILQLLSRGLDISHCCQFFNAGGAEQIASNWSAFQEFCEQSCTCEASRSSATAAAQAAFDSVERCFTSTLSQRNPSFVESN